jgi:hypothetical protein
MLDTATINLRHPGQSTAIIMQFAKEWIEERLESSKPPQPSCSLTSNANAVITGFEKFDNNNIDRLCSMEGDEIHDICSYWIYSPSDRKTSKAVRYKSKPSSSMSPNERRLLDEIAR